MSKRVLPKPRVMLIGSYPPPFGGIAVHIKRLQQEVLKQGFDCTVYDLNNSVRRGENVEIVKSIRLWLVKLLFSGKEDIIHMHSPSLKLRIALGFMSIFGKKTVISIHGDSLKNSLGSAGQIKKLVVRFFINRCSRVITVNPCIKEYCLSIGISENKLACVQPFIKPNVEEISDKNLPKEISNFTVARYPIICANAFKPIYENGLDIYGLDRCIELCRRLKKDYPDVCFILCLACPSKSTYLTVLKKRIEEYGLAESFLIHEGGGEFLPVIQKSHIFVRPNRKDGYGISVAEAISLGTPAIASNVCKRAKGCVLFDNADNDDFYVKTLNVVRNYDYHKAKTANVRVTGGAEEIIKIYREILGTEEGH